MGVIFDEVTAEIEDDETPTEDEGGEDDETVRDKRRRQVLRRNLRILEARAARLRAD